MRDLIRRHTRLMPRATIARDEIAKLAADLGPKCARVVGFFIQHGLPARLPGTAEPMLQHHGHHYQQRFLFDEAHGTEDVTWAGKDFLFVRPALAEWISAQPERLNQPFGRLEVGLVGDMLAYESQPPLMRLCAAKGKVALSLRGERRMSTVDKGAASDLLRFLFVLLCACREFRRTRINVAELREIWEWLRGAAGLKAALQVHLPTHVDVLAERIRDWAKKINRDRDVREFLQAAQGSDSSDPSRIREGDHTRTLLEPFLSVSAPSRLGAQIEIWLPKLRLDELDFDASMRALMASRPR